MGEIVDDIKDTVGTVIGKVTGNNEAEEAEKPVAAPSKPTRPKNKPPSTEPHGTIHLFQEINGKLDKMLGTIEEAANPNLEYLIEVVRENPNYHNPLMRELKPTRVDDIIAWLNALPSRDQLIHDLIVTHPQSVASVLDYEPEIHQVIEQHITDMRAFRGRSGGSTIFDEDPPQQTMGFLDSLLDLLAETGEVIKDILGRMFRRN